MADQIPRDVLNHINSVTRPSVAGRGLAPGDLITMDGSAWRRDEKLLDVAEAKQAVKLFHNPDTAFAVVEGFEKFSADAIDLKCMLFAADGRGLGHWSYSFPHAAS